MSRVEVFDPAMCCATGVCGPAVDPVLVRAAGDLAWLAGQGVTVERFNLGQQPEQFATRPEILAELRQDAEVLPIVRVDGRVVSRREYPTRAQLAGWCGLTTPAERVSLPLL